MNSEIFSADDLNDLDVYLATLADLFDECTETCVECKSWSNKDESWECPKTGNKRCSHCQIDHEMNECTDCRLAYEDL